MFRHDVAGTHVVNRLACRDISKDFATGTQRLAAHCFGHAPQEWTDITEETVEKIADHMASLKVERGAVDGTEPRGDKSTSSLI